MSSNGVPKMASPDDVDCKEKDASRPLNEDDDEAAIFTVTGASTAPLVDRFFVVYIILIIHGIGTLMPWNMFINANDYFVNYKLAPVSNVTSVDAPSSDQSSQPLTGYQIYFLNVLGFVAQIPNVLLSAFNTFCQCKGGNSSVRIVWSIITVLTMFVLTVVLAMIDSREWPAGFFWITMLSVVVINMANGIYQNSVYGAAAILPMKYTNAVVLGSNLSGTFTSVINVIAIAGTPDQRASAIYYFLTAIFVLVLAFDCFFVLDFLPFYQHYKLKSIRKASSSDDVNKRPPYKFIFRKCWVHFYCVFFVFFISLTCFPAISAGTARSDENFFITEKYFGAVTCFLFFNVFALAGNIVSAFVQTPGPRWLWIPVTARVLFIPFFMFCNVTPDLRWLPVLIPNDYVYSIGSILLGFTSGYYCSLAMMYAPRNVEGPNQPIAGMMGALFLVLGIFCGIAFSTPVKLLIGASQHSHSGPYINNTDVQLAGDNSTYFTAAWTTVY